MSADPFQEARRKDREEYARETAHEATVQERARREEELREHVSPAFRDLFDRNFHEEFGRWPIDSPRAGTAAPVSARRREAVQALIDRGATEGEREAARAAMHRLDHPSETAHAATERGSYYARDTLAGSSDERSHE